MRRIFLALTCLIPLSAAAAATLRPLTTLARPVVLLSDLFDDAGPDGTKVLGPGPAPGGRIVVEAAQLAAIARQFGVDWRPNSPADRAVLDRPGRLLPKDQVMAAIRAALTGVGAPSDCDIELSGFESPLVPAESAADTTVEQLEYEGGSARFSGVLTVTAPGLTTMRQRISGYVEEMEDVAVASRRLPAGSLIGPTDVQIRRLRATLVHGDAAHTAADAVGLSVKRMAMAGQPLLLADLGRPNAVTKGGRVTVELQMPGLSLTVQGQVMDSAALGDRVTVLNPASRALLDAEVIGPDRVRVAPGSFAVSAGRDAGDTQLAIR